MTLSQDSTQGRKEAKRRKENSLNSSIFGLFRVFCIFASVFSALQLSAHVSAQETTPEPRLVTADEVNAVAGRMYCPVCEYVPLDTCGEPACIVWKNEIYSQLAAGRTEDQIMADFVARFGDRVVGVPQNTGLRLLSIVAPILAAVLAAVIGLMTFSRWRKSAQMNPVALQPSSGDSPEGDDYRARLERDLRQ